MITISITRTEYENPGYPQRPSHLDHFEVWPENREPTDEEKALVHHLSSVVNTAFFVLKHDVNIEEEMPYLLEGT